jgi:ring-1,2-phenylacetyl-CoA epoxidase subunit PaaC
VTSSSLKPQLPLSPGAVEWVLAFADDEHMIGSRHAAWIGLGPFLEEDLAFCSIAQDELGHAIALYEFLTDDVDHFALLRPSSEYRSCWLAELPCDQWDLALVRHWLYDRAEQLRWQSLATSSVAGLAALAARAEREETFHRDHAELFLRRLAEGDDVGRAKITVAIDGLLGIATGIWDPVDGEIEAISDGVVASTSAALAIEWKAAVLADIERWGLDVIWPEATKLEQAARTARSSHFETFHASLQEVMIIDQSATW